ncbi:hypothetical protein C8A00DRAFT_32068 [Chaetomidium leptoderma]|uniref:3-hydroxyacyl-CoA dehydrogenase n=1 Tax=Chaetomidium leptoderma TaxID=669021 RepID=A0AAN6ZY15_9PEZI|nr:hypothetical protein C8A00DRAFT_32068 [Chaetomidium leptoderma]
MTWQPPTVGERPVVVLGAGVLGRRIACCFLAGGYNVHSYDTFSESLQGAAHFKAYDDLEAAVKEAFLIIEAVPEKLQLKIDMFGELDKKCPADCVIGSNSSSFKSSLMLDKISPERRKLICNVHFTMPPEIRTVELMTDGETHPEVLSYLTEVLARCGMLPVTAKKESTGFIFNRLWAAVKRETLMILAEGVSDPAQIDLLWANMFKAQVSPCRLMDQIGLDTVAFIEDNYIQERKLDGTLTVDWLRHHYLDQGKKGLKSDKGGLYPPPSPSSSGQPLYVLDVGLGEDASSIDAVSTNGKVLRLDPASGRSTAIVTRLSLPDGIDVSETEGRIFWTDMGRSTSTDDGSVMSSKLDGTDIRTLVPEGKVHTPKQLIVVDQQRKVYFCDREGAGVYRCDFDGKNFEVLVQRRSDGLDMTQWCVGVAVDVAAGKLYWTQKGPSKAGKGRIFRANLEIPAGEPAEKRSDIELLLENLPEPIDLDLDVEAQALYWTDRGEHPTGSSLNRIFLSSLGGAGKQTAPEIVARHFHEPIGVKVDRKHGRVFVTDLGGSVYQVDLKTGEKKVIHSDGGCYTGIALHSWTDTL